MFFGVSDLLLATLLHYQILVSTVMFLAVLVVWLYTLGQTRLFLVSSLVWDIIWFYKNQIFHTV